MQLSNISHLLITKSLIHSASHHAQGTLMREFNLDLAAYHVVQWWASISEAEKELRMM